MTSSSPFLRRATALAIIVATPAIAQDQTIRGLEKFSLQPSAPTPTPTPSPAATPVPVPSAPRLALPGPTPTPMPTPTAVRTASPRSIPTVRPTPTPTPDATPSAAASSAPIAAQTPLPPPVTAAPAIAEPPADIGDWTPWLIGGLVAAAIVVGGWLLLRQRRNDDQPEPEAVYEPAAEPPPPPPPLERGRIAIAMRPIKAGVNLLSATVESEITLANTGDAPAQGIRLDVRLLSAHAGQDAELAAIAALPVARPAVPVFALAAGEERRVRAVAALPRDAIRAMTAGGRQMFVPLVAINVIYDAGQTHQAFAIGVDRADSTKLAPFWLDGPPRTFDTVAARPHAPAVER